MVEVPTGLTPEQQEEILRFDVLYRVNAQGKGEKSVLLSRAEDMLDGAPSSMSSARLKSTLFSPLP